MHEAEEILLSDLVVVLKAVITFEYELRLLLAVDVNEFLDCANVLCVLAVRCVAEVKKLGIGEPAVDRLAQLRLVVHLQVLLEHSFVKAVLPPAQHLLEVASDVLGFGLGELKFLLRGLHVLHLVTDALGGLLLKHFYGDGHLLAHLRAPAQMTTRGRLQLNPHGAFLLRLFPLGRGDARVLHARMHEIYVAHCLARGLLLLRKFLALFQFDCLVPRRVDNSLLLWVGETGFFVFAAGDLGAMVHDLVDGHALHLVEVVFDAVIVVLLKQIF